MSAATIPMTTTEQKQAAKKITCTRFEAGGCATEHQHVLQKHQRLKNVFTSLSSTVQKDIFFPFSEIKIKT